MIEVSRRVVGESTFTHATCMLCDFHVRNGAVRSKFRRRRAAFLVLRPRDSPTVPAESDALLTSRLSATMLGCRQVVLRLLGRQQQDRTYHRTVLAVHRQAGVPGAIR
jgi:hypothetical protein